MAVNIPETGKKRIVIVGAGFAGLKLARKLKNKDYQIVLIDRNNYHQFQPLFYQVATSGLEPSAISFPLRKVFQKEKNVSIRITQVTGINPAKKQIETPMGEVWYDYLVIATGATTNYFGMEGVTKYGIPMKSVSEAVYLRNSLLLNFEKAVTQSDPKELERLLNVVVVGGGPTGVEVCGALAEMKRFILPKDYPDINFDLMQITLIEANPHLLHGMSGGAAQKSLDYLKQMGVNVLLDKRVTAYDGKTINLASGEELQSETLVWAAGVRGQIPEGVDPKFMARGNRVKVNCYNEVEGMDGVFAIGDIAYMETPRYASGHPQVAQVALQQADNLANNFIRVAQGKNRTEFEYKNKGSMATVGRNRAVVDLPFWKFSGPFAWLVWMFIHLMSIVGVKNRLLIFINWLWKYFTFDQSLRLILRPSRKAQERPL
ncbi:NAD(P)/FAD-dependent oxidoreductase [Mangrovibacterium marinum]|uniref:NADH:ubiquinone reductase (non-electrogenic) n=1 Tax=Mangrovibacterium marinum TaxID=1639118 RepID=A0A2T5C4H4_9BACT|nr:NAD(P)/FAD-dependent oxidoreductase [Mangrovibacterium marinum]PTN09764.1 NADH dehydrogenase [Mangrovibacterium marinum]